MGSYNHWALPSSSCTNYAMAKHRDEKNVDELTVHKQTTNYNWLEQEVICCLSFIYKSDIV